MSFIGDLHPLLVHFPVGIIGLALLFKVLYFFTQNEVYSKPMQPMILIGLIVSILSVLSGLLHAEAGKITGNDLNWHRLYGILLSLILGILYLSMYKKREYPHIFTWSLLGVLLFFTGETGALLTHGYNLFQPKINSSETDFKIENINEANAYSDLVAPVFANKCYSCHSSKKQKGRLRLDTKQSILEGGEHGKIIATDSTGESKLLTNLHLPIEEDDHMPPQGKPQLTDTELKIITWWVENGADFDKKIKEIENYTEIKSLLENKVASLIINTNSNPIININAKKPNATSMQNLINAGISVNPISQNSPLLSVHLNNRKLSKEVVSALNNLNENIIFVKVQHDTMNTGLISTLQNFTNLTVLDLRYSHIASQDLSQLNKLKKLEDLNLVGSDITNADLVKLNLSGLKKLYLYQTKITSAEAQNYKNLFPGLIIDTGNYQVPILKLDTSEYTRDQYNLENNIIPVNKK